MADVVRLASLILGARPDDQDSLRRLQESLTAATDICCSVKDPEYAEQLLRCIFESFCRAGATGRDVLDQVLLEVLPHMAPLAALSANCAEVLSIFCDMAAEACSPRDTVTACLEVLDQLLSNSPSVSSLQFLCTFLELLPRLLKKLSRRKAAFITECLMPVRKLARMQGQVLQSWLLVQLGIATDSCDALPLDESSNSCKDVLHRGDTFLSASWQPYETFVRDVLMVLPDEADPAVQQSCKRAIGNLILHLLLHLTAAWPPPTFAPLALQLIQSMTAPAAQLPTASSVLAPTPMMSVGSRKQAKPAADSHPCQQPTSQPPRAADTSSSDAASVVQSLLELLRECGLGDWQALAQIDSGAEAAGAALAALYNGCLCEVHDAEDLLHGNLDRIDVLQAACSWSLSLSEASQGNPLVVFKAIALVQLAAAQAKILSDTWSTAAAASTSSQQTANSEQDSKPAVAAARCLLPKLQPCVRLLASSSISGSPVLRSQASLAMQQLFRAQGPAVSYVCFKDLLCATANKQVHPELAALLFQEVRMQLATNQQGWDSPFAGWGSVELVIPWLQQNGASGWQDTDQLADRANAICAALAVVRLSLLKSKVPEAHAAAEAEVQSEASPHIKAELEQVLAPLSAAVTQTLGSLQMLNGLEQGLQQQSAGANSSTGQQQVRIPGEAEGTGQAVDAWLAVSRVQDVLDRVLELL